MSTIHLGDCQNGCETCAQYHHEGQEVCETCGAEQPLKIYRLQTSTTLWLYTDISARSEEEALAIASERDFSRWEHDYDLGACDSPEIIEEVEL